jgi:dTDP-4-dehydrorhamnose reductase
VRILVAGRVGQIARSLLEFRGVFRMTAAGEASSAYLAQAVFDAPGQVGGPAAKRPANSQLECSRLEQIHGLRLPHWRESLKAVAERLVQPGAPGALNR